MAAAAIADFVAVSIHAPVRGATHLGFINVLVPQCFNPRAREGRDETVFVGTLYGIHVSIHAPVRGATQHKYRIIEALKVSIHAPVRGATRV